MLSGGALWQDGAVRYFLVAVGIIAASCSTSHDPYCLIGAHPVNGKCEPIDGGEVVDSPTPMDAAIDAPTVGDPAPCLIGGSVLHLDGNDVIYTGMLTVTAGKWYPVNGNLDTVDMELAPTDPQQGAQWSIVFRVAYLNVTLKPGIYDKAMLWPGETAGHPGLQVFGDHRCTTATGRFEIFKYLLSGSTVMAVTATFEQYCDGSTNVLRGCVHYEP